MELSFISWESTVEGCLLNGVSLHLSMQMDDDSFKPSSGPGNDDTTKVISHSWEQEPITLRFSGYGLLLGIIESNLLSLVSFSQG